MPRHPPQPSEAIAIPHDSWFKLYTGRLQDMDNPKELWEVAVEAIDEWTRRHHPDGFTQVTHVGYQWKHLFLPPGTLLRTIFRGKNYHCLVEAEHLLYEGKPVSPNVFVNAVGGIRRNAWRSIWVLYPNTTEWKLADTLRTRTRSRPTRARKPRGAAEIAALPTVKPGDSGSRGEMSNAPPTSQERERGFNAQAGAVAGQPAVQSQPQQPDQSEAHMRPQAADQPELARAGSTTHDSSSDIALARLLAELLAFLQRLPEARLPAASRGDSGRTVMKLPTYALGPSGYVWSSNSTISATRSMSGRATLLE